MKRSSVCVWYVTANEEKLLDLSTSVMSKYDWVDRILVLYTTAEPINGYPMGKEIHYHSDFGNSIEKPLPKGGFREIDARNYAIELAEKTGCDWLLQYDSDEFYTESLGKEIERLNNTNVMSIKTQTWRYRDQEYHIAEVGKMVETHTRLWRNGLNIRYEENQNQELMKHWKNKQAHCVVNAEPVNHFLQGIYHIHTHDIWPWKRQEFDISKHELVRQPIDFPIEYKRAIQELR